jgi:hypothetical protein
MAPYLAGRSNIYGVNLLEKPMSDVAVIFDAESGVVRIDGRDFTTSTQVRVANERVRTKQIVTSHYRKKYGISATEIGKLIVQHGTFKESVLFPPKETPIHPPAKSPASLIYNEPKNHWELTGYYTEDGVWETRIYKNLNRAIAALTDVAWQLPDCPILERHNHGDTT